MNQPPEILINSGFRTDQNGALDEIVIPKVVNTCNAPRKVTFLGQTLNYIPTVAAALQELDCPNIVTWTKGGLFTSSYSALTTVRFRDLKSAALSGSGGMFVQCNAITTADFPNLEFYSDSAMYQFGMFSQCNGLTSLRLPKLVSVEHSASNIQTAALIDRCGALINLELPELQISKGPLLYMCNSIQDIILPKFKTGTASSSHSKGTGIIYSCTGLLSITLGSEGNPVEAIPANAFNGCTQSGLIITIYTSGGAALANEPWGATNATIEYEEA